MGRVKGGKRSDVEKRKEGRGEENEGWKRRGE
jgi:hypothetical protein